MKRFVLLALASLAFAGNALAAKYAIDPSHTQVEFTYSHFGFSNITGRFDQVGGEFELDTADLSKSRIDVTIPIASISTGVDKLDQHLLGPDFFDAAKYPNATFSSTAVHVIDARKLHVVGNLTIHGVTRPATLDVTVNRIAEHPMKKVPAAGFDGVTRIKRSDFGIGAYAPAVSDEVEIRITLEATAAK